MVAGRQPPTEKSPPGEEQLPDMKLTILFPRFKTFSGAEHHVLKFAHHAQLWGHQVSILTRGFDEACSPYLHRDISLRIPKLTRWLTGNHLVDSFLDVICSPFLLTHVPKTTDVLCFFCDPSLPALWLYKRLYRGGIPTVYYCLQPPRFVYDLMAETIAANKPLGYLIPLMAPLYRAMDKIAARSCDMLFANSKEYAVWCKELYGNTPIRVMSPGVDLDIAKDPRPDRIRKRYAFDPDEKLVVTVNKLIPRKNLDVFLRAARRIVDRVPDARIAVVGDGPIRSSLTGLANDLGLGERVLFTGFVRDFSDVIAFYAACDVYVFLERNVPFGLTLLEASVCGAPVVTVRGGGALETTIDGKTGFFVSPELDPEEVADKVCWLLENDEERLAMGRRAAQHARKFSWEARAHEFVTTLEELVVGKEI